MTKEMTIVEARRRMTSLPEELHGRDSVTVTRRGKPVLSVMPYELFDSIMETLDVMSDPELMAILRQSILEADNGETVPWRMSS